jgi:hypothetical protein
VQSCLNLRGPSRKPKYSLSTDSERVPRGKGEKNPGEGSQKNLKSCVYKQGKRYGRKATRDSVPFAS